MAERPIRIMAVHRYYYPDTPPYATILRHIVRQWVADGHEVDVLTSQPSYKKSAGVSKRASVETLDGARVSRINLPPEHGRPLVRLLNTLRFFLAIILRAVRGHYDAIMVSTAPPVIPGLAGRIAARLTGARLVYHCMDIHPEIGKISGDFSNPLVYRALEHLDAGTCKHAERVVVLSDDMAEAVRSRKGCADVRLEVINNFALRPEKDEQQIPLPDLPEGEVRLLFAGNIGRFQGLEHFVDAFHRLAERGRMDAHLVFMGEGAALSELKQRAKGPGESLIHFLPHQPVAVATAMMQRVELGVVSLVGGIYKYAYPSKTTTYIDNGCPMLVAVEKTSRLAHDVEAAGIGKVVEPGDPEGITAVIEAVLDDPTLISAMKTNVSAAAAQHEMSRVLSRWSGLIKDVSGETA